MVNFPNILVIFTLLTRSSLFVVRIKPSSAISSLCFFSLLRTIIISKSQEYIRWLMSLITISSPCYGFMKYYWELTRQSLVYLHNYNRFHFSLSFSLNAFHPPANKILLCSPFIWYLPEQVYSFPDASQKFHFTKFEQHL